MLKKIFNEIEVKNNFIVLDGQFHGAIISKHSIWIPDLELKLIWSINGMVESTVWDKGSNKDIIEQGVFNEISAIYNTNYIESICNEYAIFGLLSQNRMSPPIDGFCFIKNVTSNILHKISCDCRGLYGYYIKNANYLPKGNFNFELFKKEYIDTGIIKASNGALGDINKKDNVINGYLIDIRRTLWDMVELDNIKSNKFNEIFHRFIQDLYTEDINQLQESIKKYTQFPHRERKQNYQSYYLGDKYIDGSRDTLQRFDKMKIPVNLQNKTVLDLGCCLGAMCIESYRRGARWVTGLEYEKDYLDNARALARYNKMNINFMRKDLNNIEDVIGYINAYYLHPIDIVFALSLYKHIGRNLWEILKNIKWKECYIESNNSPGGYLQGQGLTMDKELKSYPVWQVEQIGMTEDRSPRCLWRLTR